jgi:uncharacterized protein (DUF58 family)
MPTRRTLLFLITAAMPFVLAGVSPLAIYIALLANLTVIILYTLDLHQLPARHHLSLQREMARNLSLNEPGKVVLTISNESPWDLTGTLQENPPRSCRPSPQRVELSVPHRRKRKLTYALRPLKRGHFSFAESVLRVHGPLSMAFRDYHFVPPPKDEDERTGWEFTVYPRIGGATRRSMAALAHRMESGYHRLEREVEGTTPSQLRKWQTGDSYRDVNWKASARYDHPMVTQFDTERNQSVYIFVDCGHLMALPVGELQKIDYAVNACADLARVATERGDQVGICCFSSTIQTWMGAQSKRRHLLRILEGLAEVRADSTATDFAAPLNFFLSRSQRRSLCLFLTTFSESVGAEGLMDRLRLLRPRHVPAVVSLIDPELEKAIHQEPTTFQDACRKLAAADLREEIDLLAQQLRRRQGYFLETRADMLSAGTVETYLDVKARGAL